MKAPDRIFLVGPMGAGKTAVGRHLAQSMGLEFKDSDAEIEASTGVDIGFIFEKEGEAGFRRRESTAIDALTQRKHIVVATGGGAILASENRRCLASRGYVVYLHTSVEQQVERTGRGRARPLLNSGDPREKLAELLVEREPLYRELASFIVSTDGRSVTSVAREIQKHLIDEFS